MLITNKCISHTCSLQKFYCHSISESTMQVIRVFLFWNEIWNITWSEESQSKVPTRGNNRLISRQSLVIRDRVNCMRAYSAGTNQEQEKNCMENVVVHHCSSIVWNNLRREGKMVQLTKLLLTYVLQFSEKGPSR